MQRNLEGIRDALWEMNADPMLLQEVDVNSGRSYGTVETIDRNFVCTDHNLVRLTCVLMP
ncbi:MAG: hypothetical protein IKP40_00825 [Clostridia bacterium]|nr:hypothetical protein [Clostridia bacterium]